MPSWLKLAQRFIDVRSLLASYKVGLLPTVLSKCWEIESGIKRANEARAPLLRAFVRANILQLGLRTGNNQTVMPDSVLAVPPILGKNSIASYD